MFVRWYFNNPFLPYISEKRFEKEVLTLSQLVARHCRSLASMFFLCVHSVILVEGQFLSNPLQSIDAQCSSTKCSSVHLILAVGLSNYNYPRGQVGEYIATELGGVILRSNSATFLDTTSALRSAHQLILFLSNNIITKLIFHASSHCVK